MIIGGGLSILYGTMWLRFQRLAYGYELRSMIAVQEKISADLKKMA
jgi:hypothetical protein